MKAEWLGWPETQALVKAFGDAPMRFVGGCVRDALLGRVVQDVDVATALLPQEAMKLLQGTGIKVIPTGIDHGTVTAVINKRHFEITTLRKDVTTDGRRATVAYTDDWKQDAERRDFTMNALYCDASGTISDYFNGEKDAREGRVRFIGDAHTRIMEDGLRTLRFFRFFAHYGKDPIDADGLAACKALAERIDMLSGERIQMEMFKLLVAERAGQVVEQMQQSGVWLHIVPQALHTRALKALPTVLAKAGCAPDPILSLAALLRTAKLDNEELISWIHQRWKLSNAHHKRLVALCGGNPDDWKRTGSKWEERRVKRLIRMWGREAFIEMAALWMVEGANEEEGLRAIKLAHEWPIPAFPVTGDDLLAKGIKGKAVGETLKELESAWEDGGYEADKKALLARVG